MKIERKRKVNRLLSFFCNHFGFHEPYQVLIDGTFTMAALEWQVQLNEELPRYFGCEVKILTTQCVVLELEKLGSRVRGALVIAKQFGVHKCGHERQPIQASSCLKSMIQTNGSNNPKRYIIATQDQELKEFARSIPGTPVLHLHHRSLNLEKESKASTMFVSNQAKLMGYGNEMERLRHLKEQVLDAPKLESRPKKKKKRGGPNALSCKKKAKPSVSNKNQSSTQGLTEKKRIRKRIAKHIIEELKNKTH